MSDSPDSVSIRMASRNNTVDCLDWNSFFLRRLRLFNLFLLYRTLSTWLYSICLVVFSSSSSKETESFTAGWLIHKR